LPKDSLPSYLSKYEDAKYENVGGWIHVVLYLKLFTDSTVIDWSSLLMTMLFFNGVVLIMLGGDWRVHWKNL
jgi:hypothetical protein